MLFLISASALSSLVAPALALAAEVIDATGARVRVPDRPERVVTLAPSLGELAADIAGDELSRIVGVSEYTDFPAALGKVESVGPYHRFNLEKVRALKPDLVLATLDGNSRDQVLHLRELGVPVVIVRTGDFAEVGQSIRLVARALGDPARGEQMAAQLARGLERIRARARERVGRPKVMIQIGDQPLVVAGSQSFLQDALEAIGAANAYGDVKAGYPRPSLEDVVSRDPDRILVLVLDASSLGFFKEAAARWARFPRMKAVSAKRVSVHQNDMVLRPTLRLLEGLARLEKAVHGAK